MLRFNYAFRLHSFASKLLYMAAAAAADRYRYDGYANE
jgi:hypothetical protein